MNYKILTYVWVTILVLVSFASAQSYSVITLGSLGGAVSTAAGINDKAQVAGTSWLQHSGFGHLEHAFLWTSGKGMTDLGTLGGHASNGFALNDGGDVVGSSWVTGDASQHAFLWTESAGMQDLGTVGGDSSAALAINDAGEVAGWSVTTTGSTDAFVWTQSGGIKDIGNLGGSFAAATGVASDGSVTGYSTTATDTRNHLFLWTSTGGTKDLGRIGANPAMPTAINSHRTIVGAFFPPKNASIQAFVRFAKGVPQDIAPGAALAINVGGTVVGMTTPDSNGDAAFLWTQTGGVQDLGTMIPAHTGKTLTAAVGINTSGKIIANEATTGTTKVRPILLLPVKTTTSAEPSRP
jgi:probable HAF family extracellular repeat protein